MTGWVVWLTGLPQSGKSTLAERLRRELDDRGRACAILDGDAVRAALVPPPGYGAGDRDAFYATLAGLAALLARQGLIVLVPATAHRATFRERARTLAPRFIEVYLRASAETCAARDLKGLYALARAGAAPTLPGVGVDYEPPQAPDVVADGGEDSAAVRAVLARVTD